MKFKLPRQIVNKSITDLMSREIKRQRIALPRLSKHHLKELTAIAQTIEKKGLPKTLVRRKLPNSLGYGLFLHPKAKPILKGQLIAPYAGEVYVSPENDSEDLDYAFAPLNKVLLTKEEQPLIDKKRNWHPKRRYLLNVDALRKGNYTRFINHSNKPNVVVEFLRVPPNPQGHTPCPIEIFYFAKKTIHPGEQLLVSYEDGENSYWGVMNIKPFPVTPKTFQLNSALKIFSS